MRFLKLLLPAIILSTMLLNSSCSYKPQQVLFAQQQPTPDIGSTAQNNSAYRIQPRDQLQIRNLQNIRYIVDETPGSSGTTTASGATAAIPTFEVDEDGSVVLPVIGRVPVAGLTRRETAKQITDMYRKNLLKDPIIDVKILNLKVTLLGEVKAPGNYPLDKDRTTLIDIIGQSGGLTDRADERTIKVVRRGESKQQVFIVNLRDIKSLDDSKLILQNNDVIYVTQNKKAVREQNVQGFAAILQPGILLLNTALVLYTLFKK